jgi:hypothetical protein
MKREQGESGERERGYLDRAELEDRRVESNATPVLLCPMRSANLFGPLTTIDDD